MLDFKGIFGAIMREGICYDLRSRVGAKACFSTIVRCTCLSRSPLCHTGLYLFSGHRHIHWILEEANKNIGGDQFVKKEHFVEQTELSRSTIIAQMTLRGP